MSDDDGTGPSAEDVIRATDTNRLADRSRRYQRFVDEIPNRAEMGVLFHGGRTTECLLSDAEQSFVYGFAHASLLAAHLFCQRQVLAFLYGHEDHELTTLNQGAERAEQLGYITTDLKVRLQLLEERAVAMRFDAEDAVVDGFTRRMADLTIARDERDVEEVLDDDAFDGIVAAVDLLLALNRIV